MNKTRFVGFSLLIILLYLAPIHFLTIPFRESLSNLPASRPITCVPLSFGQPTPFSYPIEQWSDFDFEVLFQDMARDGVEIISLAGWGEDVAYWPSSVLESRYETDYCGRVFDLAEENGIAVMLAGVMPNFDDLTEEDGFVPEVHDDRMDRVFAELHTLYGARDGFWGWGVPIHNGTMEDTGPRLDALRDRVASLKRLTPDKPVVLLPWSTPYLAVGLPVTTPEEFAAQWEAILSAAPGLDACAIPNSVAPPDTVADWYVSVTPVFDRHGVELWAAVEVFPRSPKTGRAGLQSLPPSAVIRRMAALDPVVDRLAGWDYQNLMNPRSRTHGARDFGLLYRDWMEEARPGQTPESTPHTDAR